MASQPDRFGPFLVLNLVGSGGMGEVYRARDSRLNRDVAIKVLTSARPDPERHRRFSDEAQAASALNHPNILTVYDIGLQDDAPYIVTELVEGATLRSGLGRAPMPVRDVLDLGAQMAEGLAAAHQAGIVHRDFKPENVMVTREGRLKILDFGLARIGPREGSCDLEETLTQTSMIAGTVPYMSPEQARGAAVDYRTDQFSLGLTLYEMVGGRRAFQAESAAQTLAAIIEDEPEPIASLNAKVPAPLRWIIERCLAKDPRQRYESTTDLARQLRTLKDRLGEFSPAAEIAPPEVPRGGRLRAVVAIVALAAVAVAGAAAGRASHRASATLEAYRFTPFATEAGYQSSPAWSPDGKTIAYLAAVDGVLQVFTRAIGSPLRSQVTHVRFDCEQPFWSPDGTHVYYVSLAREQDGLWSISSAGGEPELVFENVSRAAIAPDGRTLALLRADENDHEGRASLWLSTPPGTAPALYQRSAFDKRRFVDAILRFAPDGSKLGMWSIQGEAPGSSAEGTAGRIVRAAFWVLPLRDGVPHVAPSVTSASQVIFAAPFSWLPDSRHIVSVLPRPRPGAHLWIMDTEGAEPRLITTGAAFENDPAISPDGARVASAFQQGNYDIYKLSLDHPGLEPFLTSSRNEMDPAWSPTASQLAYTTERSGTDEIWLRSATGDFERPLVTAKDFPEFDTYVLSSPAFSPDGQRVAYYREAQSNLNVDVAGNVIWISSLAGGPPVRVANEYREQDQPVWSPDGTWIAFSGNLGGLVAGKWSLMKTRVGATGAPQVLVAEIAPLSPAKWAPNGTLIAYNAPDGLSIVSPDGSSPRAIYEEGWLAFAWSEDSRELFGIRLSDDSTHLTFTSIDVETRRERVREANFLPLPIAPRPVRGFTRVSATSFLTSIVHVRSDIWLVDGFAPAASPWSRLAFWRH